MTFNRDIFQNKHFAVYGLGKAGLAVAKTMQQLSANLFLGDDTESEQTMAVLEAHGLKESYYHDLVSRLKDMDYIYVTTGLPLDHPARQISPEKQIGDLELIGQLFSGRYIAVTGTKGKTTLCHLLGYMLSQNALISHVHGEMAEGPLDNILSWTKKDVPVLEVNHVQLDSYFPSFQPHIAILLNILDDHRDAYDEEAYTRLKTSIFKFMEPGSYAIVNIDDPLISKFISEEKIPDGVKIIPISLKETQKNGVYYRNGKIISKAYGEPFSTKGLKLIGEHHLYTYMAAIAAGGILGLNLNALREFNPLEHRLEQVYICNYNIYNDSKSTIPEATKAGINALKREGYEEIVLIIGGKTKGTDMSALRDCLTSGVQSVHIYGTEKEEILNMLGDLHIKLHLYDSLEEATNGAAQNLTSQNVLLFSPGCSSKDQFSSYEERGRLFKKYISQALGL